jgi:hypothetical protein
MSASHKAKTGWGHCVRALTRPTSVQHGRDDLRYLYGKNLRASSPQPQSIPPQLVTYIERAEYPAYLFGLDHIAKLANAPTMNLVGRSIEDRTHPDVDKLFFERVHPNYREHWIESQKYYEWLMGSDPSQERLHHSTFFFVPAGNPNNPYSGKIHKGTIYLTVLPDCGFLCVVQLVEASSDDKGHLENGMPPEHVDMANWGIPTDSTTSDYPTTEDGKAFLKKVETRRKPK